VLSSNERRGAARRKVNRERQTASERKAAVIVERRQVEEQKLWSSVRRAAAEAERRKVE
jgi:hypothetical protein